MNRQDTIETMVKETSNQQTQQTGKKVYCKKCEAIYELSVSADA